MTKDEIKTAVSEVIDEKLSEFWVDRETHYEHHKFIGSWIKWFEDANKTIWHVIIKTVVIGALILMAIGAFFKLKGSK